MDNVRTLPLDICVPVNMDYSVNIVRETVGRTIVAMEHAQIIIKPTDVIVTADIQDHIVNKKCSNNNFAKYSFPVIDNCNPDPCMHGVCHNTLTHFSCRCKRGYQGLTCNQDCSTNPCMFGTCHTSPTGYVCTCIVGYSGHTCNKAPPVLSTRTLGETSTLTTTLGETSTLTTTSFVCTDSPYVTCSDQHVCADLSLRRLCPLSCGLCRKYQNSATPTTWLQIPGKSSATPTTWLQNPGKISATPTTWLHVPGKNSVTPTTWLHVLGK
ncbi:NOTCH1 [Mytilus edulis]|uniref:NOTCH1 n=1 Tax=Mytilus edulis TaxID=6550 RepID=A0A8S3Q0M1_MYTED|nr:NOTCH1 [Mytilus edulis]